GKLSRQVSTDLCLGQIVYGSVVKSVCQREQYRNEDLPGRRRSRPASLPHRALSPRANVFASPYRFPKSAHALLDTRRVATESGTQSVHQRIDASSVAGSVQQRSSWNELK